MNSVKDKSYKQGHNVYYKKNEKVGSLLMCLTWYKCLKKTAKTHVTQISDLSKLWTSCVKF